MKTYHIEEYPGVTATEIVRDLHKSSRAPCVDDKTWMVETATRCLVGNGVTVRSDTAEHFVDDLLANNLLHQLKGK